MDTSGIIPKIKKNPIIVISVGLAVAVLLFALNGSGGSEKSHQTDFWNEKLENFLENMEGVGQCEVLIFPAEKSSSENGIKGISIVCQGDSVKVKAKIKETVSTLFGISETQISINKKK